MPGDRPMTPLRITLALLLFVGALVLAAGCVGPAELVNKTTRLNANTTTPLNTDPSAYIGLNTVVYTRGDDVEFNVANEGPETSLCENYLPSYGVAYQADDGTWKYLSEPRETLPSAIFDGTYGSSRSTFRFNTANITPGRYRIQFDCGDVSREFSIRGTGTPVITPCAVQQKNTPRINISPVYDRYVGEVFELKGTTTLPAGTILSFFIGEPYARTCPYQGCVYTSISGNMTVMSGDCGLNVWSYSINLSGVSPTCDLAYCQPSHYAISVMTKNETVSDHASIKIHSGSRPVNNYLPFEVIRGEAFSYPGIAPDPSSNEKTSVVDTPELGSRSDATISEVHVWLFGNKYANMMVFPVNPDKSFNVTLTRAQTAELASGSYRMLFQYPKLKDEFDIRVQNGTYNVINANGDKFLNFYNIPDSKITGFKVMEMLEQELKKPESRDRYSVIAITVNEL